MQTGIEFVTTLHNYFVSNELGKVYFCTTEKQGLCRLGLEFFSNSPENIYLHQTK